MMALVVIQRSLLTWEMTIRLEKMLVSDIGRLVISVLEWCRQGH